MAGISISEQQDARAARRGARWRWGAVAVLAAATLLSSCGGGGGGSGGGGGDPVESASELVEKIQTAGLGCDEAVPRSVSPEEDEGQTGRVDCLDLTPALYVTVYADEEAVAARVDRYSEQGYSGSRCTHYVRGPNWLVQHPIRGNDDEPLAERLQDLLGGEIGEAGSGDPGCN